MRLAIPQGEFEQYAKGSVPLSASYIAVDCYVSNGDFDQAVELGNQWQAIKEDWLAGTMVQQIRRENILKQIYGIARSDDNE